MALSFGQQFGYPQPLTPEELARQQQIQQQVLAEQKKQEQLSRQMNRAEALRGRRTEDAGVLGIIGDTISQHAGRKAVGEVEGRQTQSDTVLSEAQAAELGHAQRMQQRGEQFSLAEAQRAASEQADLNASNERRTNRSAQATEKAALIRAAATRASSSGASRKEIEPRTYFKEKDPDAPLLTVYPGFNPTDGTRSWSWEDPVTGDFLQDQDRPPPGYRWNKEMDRTTREVTTIGARTEGKKEIVSLTADERRKTNAAQVDNDLKTIAAEGAIDLSRDSQKAIANEMEYRYKETQAWKRLDKTISSDFTKLSRAEAHEKAMQEIKSDSAWAHMVSEYGEKAALQSAEWAVRERMSRHDREGAAERAKVGHQAAMDQLDVKLGAEDQHIQWKIRADQKALDKKISQELTLADADRDHDKLSAMRDQMYELERMEYGQVHDKWLEEQKMVRQQEEQAHEAGLPPEPPKEADLRAYRKDMEAHEEFSGALTDVIDWFKPFADAGLDLEGVGTGHVNENAAIRFLLQSGAETELDAGTRGTIFRGEARGRDGQLIEYEVAPGALGQWMRDESNEAQYGYALIQRLAQKIAKAQSGLEVPHQEYLRIIASIGVGESVSDETFMQSMNDLADTSERSLRSMYYGHSKGVVDQYMTNPDTALGGEWIDVDGGQKYSRLGYPAPGNEVPLPSRSPVGYQEDVVNQSRHPQVPQQRGPVTDNVQTVLPQSTGVLAPQQDPTTDPNASLPAAAAAAAQVPQGGLLEQARQSQQTTGPYPDLNVPRRPPTDIQSSAAHIPAFLADQRNPGISMLPGVDHSDPFKAFADLTDQPARRATALAKDLYEMATGKLKSLVDGAVSVEGSVHYKKRYERLTDHYTDEYEENAKLQEAHREEAKERNLVSRAWTSDPTKREELKEKWIDRRAHKDALRQATNALKRELARREAKEAAEKEELENRLQVDPLTGEVTTIRRKRGAE